MRKRLCQLAVKKMGYSRAEVARFLGLASYAVNPMVASKEVAEWKQPVGEE
jgi:hypothetical protein